MHVCSLNSNGFYVMLPVKLIPRFLEVTLVKMIKFYKIYSQIPKCPLVLVKTADWISKDDYIFVEYLSFIYLLIFTVMAAELAHGTKIEIKGEPESNSWGINLLCISCHVFLGNKFVVTIWTTLNNAVVPEGNNLLIYLYISLTSLIDHHVNLSFSKHSRLTIFSTSKCKQSFQDIHYWQFSPGLNNLLPK